MSSIFRTRTSSIIYKNYAEMRNWSIGSTTFDSKWKSMERWIGTKIVQQSFVAATVCLLFRSGYSVPTLS